MNLRYFLYFLLSSFLFIAGCKKNEASGQTPAPDNDAAEPIGSSKNKPGLGRNGGIPEGIDLQLPPCIKTVKRPAMKFAPDKAKLHGATPTFYVAMSFVNTCCNGPVKVTLPPGMMITSDTGAEQNGLLVENVYFTVPQTNCNSLPDTTTIYLALSCLNEFRSPPIGGALNEYNISMNGYSTFKVTTDPNILKFLALLKDKPGLQVKEFITNNPVTPVTSSEKCLFRNPIGSL